MCCVVMVGIFVVGSCYFCIYNCNKNAHALLLEVALKFSGKLTTERRIIIYRVELEEEKSIQVRNWFLRHLKMKGLEIFYIISKWKLTAYTPTLGHWTTSSHTPEVLLKVVRSVVDCHAEEDSKTPLFTIVVFIISPLDFCDFVWFIWL